jgi:hypothetical protein
MSSPRDARVRSVRSQQGRRHSIHPGTIGASTGHPEPPNWPNSPQVDGMITGPVGGVRNLTRSPSANSGANGTRSHANPAHGGSAEDRSEPHRPRSGRETGPTETPSSPGPRRVHLLADVTASGHRFRARCTCGWSTTPRVDKHRAAEALETGHGYQDPVCDLCGRDRTDTNLPWSQRNDHVRVLVDEHSGDLLVVCRDDKQACWDLTRRPRLQVVRPRTGERRWR